MFITIPTGVSYKTDRFPIVTFTIMGLNVAVYLVSLGFFLARGESSEAWIFQHLWLTPASSVLHTWITSMFVHAGFLHLFGNMIYLFLFGSCVEDAIGRWKYVVFYLLGGVAAALVQIAGSPEHFSSDIPFGGASGAISACMGGFLLLYHKTKIKFWYFLLLFFRVWTGEFEVLSWIVVSFWFLKDLLFAYLSYSGGTGGGGVAFAAHSGGFVAGMGMIALYKLVMKTLPRKDHEQAIAMPAGYRLHPVRNEIANTYVLDGQAQVGPFTPSAVLEMQNLGSLSSEAFYWQEGMPEWRSLNELRDSL
jgi:membrane associated rhomboid family serine protease